MLTATLLRARVVRGTVVAQYIDPTSNASVTTATEVLERIQSCVQNEQTRGDLEATISEMCGDRRDHKLVRGLAKVATDRCDFAAEPAVDPVSFRREVFLEARKMGPIALSRGPLERPIAGDVLTVVAARHGIDIETAKGALYADLKDNHRVLRCRVPDAGWLLQRYNVATAQSVLLSASEVRIHLTAPDGPRIRQLMRWVRFHQLVVQCERDGDDLRLRLDGPQSLFKQSTRYGMQLARFLPALLLQDTPWKLEATVLWTKARHQKTFALDADRGLVSHYPDHGAYRTDAQKHFEAGFAALDSGWKLSDGETLIPLGPKRVVFPDYTFRKGRRTMHLEWVGFWRKEALTEHLADVARYAPKSLFLAVTKRLAADKDPGELPESCLVYKGALNPKTLLKRLESKKKAH